MKIAFPLRKDSLSKDYLLAEDFTENSYFGICDTTSNDIAYHAPSEFEGSENIDFLEFLISSKVESIISPGMRAMAIKLFRMNNIILYKACSNLLEENLLAFKNNELPKLSLLDTMSKSGCSPSACDSCSSNCG